MSVLVLVGSAALATVATPACTYDEAALIALPFDSFDQDFSGGWRSLANKNCTDAAANALRAYRLHHQPLTEYQRAVLNWHEGQIRAFEGDALRAIPLLLRGVSDDPDRAAFNRAFVEYALGTVAFLQHDKPALLSARARLAATPRPADWSGQQTIVIDGKTVTYTFTWPANLDVLDGLIKCFDKPYSQAYGCRPSKS